MKKLEWSKFSQQLKSWTWDWNQIFITPEPEFWSTVVHSFSHSPICLSRKCFWLTSY